MPIATDKLIPELQARQDRMVARRTAHRESMQPQLARAPRTTRCPAHPEVTLDLDDEGSVLASWRENQFTAVYAPCARCEQDAQDERERERWCKRGVPRKLALASFENFVVADDAKLAQAVRTCRDYAQSPRGILAFLGTCGSGKTHLAVSTMEYIGDGRFITHPDLLMELRATYKTGGTYKFLHRLQTARCLVLDDFGVSAGGADEAPVLYQVFSARHGADLPTIITSNEPLDSVSRLLGDRLTDRMAESYRVVNLTGDSYRRRARA